MRSKILKMKILKRSLIFILLAAVILFCFSKFKFRNSKNNLLDNLITDFDAESTIEISKNKYKCSIHHTSQHNTKIKINSPVDFEGLTVSSEKGKQKINFENLDREFDKNVFTENSFPNLIFKILDSLDDISSFSQNISQNDDVSISGKVDNIKFEVICDRSGIIKEILIPEKGVKIQASCVPLIKDKN